MSVFRPFVLLFCFGASPISWRLGSWHWASRRRQWHERVACVWVHKHSWMLTDAVPPPVSVPSAKSRAGQASSMYTSLGLSLRTTRLAVAPIQPNHAGCGNSLSNIKPATVLRLRRAPCSQTSAGSAAPTRVCCSPSSPSYFSRTAEPKLVRAPRP